MTVFSMTADDLLLSLLLLLLFFHHWALHMRQFWLGDGCQEQIVSKGILCLQWFSFVIRGIIYRWTYCNEGDAALEPLQVLFIKCNTNIWSGASSDECHGLIARNKLKYHHHCNETKILTSGSVKGCMDVLRRNACCLNRRCDSLHGKSVLR